MNEGLKELLKVIGMLALFVGIGGGLAFLAVLANPGITVLAVFIILIVFTFVIRVISSVRSGH